MRGFKPAWEKVIPTLSDLSTVLARARREGKSIVVTAGSFNPKHADHTRFLQNAASMGDVLLVFVKGDAAVRLKNKTRPVIPAEERAENVAAVEGVDYVFVVEYNAEYEVETAYDDERQRQWLSIFEGPIKVIKPDFWAHEDSEELKTARARLFEACGVTSIPVDRGKRTSSTAFWNAHGVN